MNVKYVKELEMNRNNHGRHTEIKIKEEKKQPKIITIFLFLYTMMLISCSVILVLGMMYLDDYIYSLARMLAGILFVGFNILVGVFLFHGYVEPRMKQ